MLQIHSPKER